jgi:hypothetical protein
VVYKNMQRFDWSRAVERLHLARQSSFTALKFSAAIGDALITEYLYHMQMSLYLNYIIRFWCLFSNQFKAYTVCISP